MIAVVVAIVATLVAAFALVVAWGVALRLRDVDRLAAEVCMELHARLQEAEAALATHARQDAALAAAVIGAALATAIKH